MVGPPSPSGPHTVTVLLAGRWRSGLRPGWARGRRQARCGRCHCTTKPLNGCAWRPTARRTVRRRLRVERRETRTNLRQGEGGASGGAAGGVGESAHACAGVEEGGPVADLQMREAFRELCFEGVDGVQAAEPDHHEQVVGAADGHGEADLLPSGRRVARAARWVRGSTARWNTRRESCEGVGQVAAEGDDTVPGHPLKPATGGVLAHPGRRPAVEGAEASVRARLTDSKVRARHRPSTWATVAGFAASYVTAQTTGRSRVVVPGGAAAVASTLARKFRMSRTFLRYVSSLSHSIPHSGSRESWLDQRRCTRQDLFWLRKYFRKTVESIDRVMAFYENCGHRTTGDRRSPRVM